MKIKAYIGYSERKKQFYYKNFTIVNELPHLFELNDVINSSDIQDIYRVCCTDINEISLDPEQPNNDVYNYDYFELEYFDIESYLSDKQMNDEDGEETLVIDYLEERYVCIEKQYDEETEEE